MIRSILISSACSVDMWLCRSSKLRTEYLLIVAELHLHAPCWVKNRKTYL